MKLQKFRKKIPENIIPDAQEHAVPECPYFKSCGGCLLEDYSYPDQLKFKQDGIEEVLGIRPEIIPSPKVYGYRNRIDCVISINGIGFRKFNRWWDIVNIEECKLFGPRSRDCLQSLRRFISAESPSLRNLHANSGFFRYLVIRETKFTNELMAILITDEGTVPDSFYEYFDFCDSVYWCVNSTLSDVSNGVPRHFHGKQYIIEEIEGIRYLIHPNSFFQSNPFQLGSLLKKVSEYATQPNVLDLYCGVGTFGLYLASEGRKVKGIEMNPFSIEMANKNAELNALDMDFMVGEDSKVENLNSFGTIVLDPPRAGLHPRLIQRLIKEKPKELVYVSCSPFSLKENLDSLKNSYEIEEICAFDLFPHTMHVETVVKLKSLP